MNQDITEGRLLEYAKRCVLLSRSLLAQHHEDGKHLAKQLLRSGSHPGIHYGEARAAESRRDMAHKLGVLLKELRESYNTVRLVEMMEFYPPERLSFLLRQGNELIAMMTVTVRKLKSNPR